MDNFGLFTELKFEASGCPDDGLMACLVCISTI